MGGCVMCKVSPGLDGRSIEQALSSLTGSHRPEDQSCEAVQLSQCMRQPHQLVVVDLRGQSDVAVEQQHQNIRKATITLLPPPGSRSSLPQDHAPPSPGSRSSLPQAHAPPSPRLTLLPPPGSRSSLPQAHAPPSPRLTLLPPPGSRSSLPQAHAPPSPRLTLLPPPGSCSSLPRLTLLPPQAHAPPSPRLTLLPPPGSRSSLPQDHAPPSPGSRSSLPQAHAPPSPRLTLLPPQAHAPPSPGSRSSLPQAHIQHPLPRLTSSTVRAGNSCRSSDSSLSRLSARISLSRSVWSHHRSSLLASKETLCWAGGSMLSRHTLRGTVYQGRRENGSMVGETPGELCTQVLCGKSYSHSGTM